MSFHEFDVVVPVAGTCSAGFLSCSAGFPLVIVSGPVEQGIIEENLDALRDILSMTYLGTHYGYNTSNEEQLKNLMSYLDSIYTGTPYSVSSELSRRSAGMFRDIVTENQFRPDLNKWLVMGGLTQRRSR